MSKEITKNLIMKYNYHITLKRRKIKSMVHVDK